MTRRRRPGSSQLLRYTAVALLVLGTAWWAHAAEAGHIKWMDPQWKAGANLGSAQAVAIAIDTSGSITRARLKKEISVATDIVRELVRSNPGVLLQIFTFNADIQVEWPGNGSTIAPLSPGNLAEVEQAICQIKATKNLTWLSGAIQHACNITDPEDPSGDDKGPGTGSLVLLTDGRPTTDVRNGGFNMIDADAAARNAASLFKANCSTLAIVGIDVSLDTETYLRDIASEDAYLYISTSTLVFNMMVDEYRDVYVMDWDGSNLENVTGTPDLDEYWPIWSPSGTQLAYEVCEMPAWNPTPRPADIFVVDLGSLAQVPITEALVDTVNVYPVWSPDGERLLFLSGSPGNWNPFQRQMGEMFLVGCNGKGLTQLTDREKGGPEGPDSAFPFAWSPDGEKIAYVSADAWEEEVWLCTMSADGSSVEQLVDFWELCDWYPDIGTCRLQWDTDGIHLTFRTKGDGSGIHKQWFALVSEQGAQDTSMVSLPERAEVYGFSLSPDARQISYVLRDDAGSMTMHVADFDGDKSVHFATVTDRLGVEFNYYSTPVWSSDGRMLAFWAQGYVYDVERFAAGDVWGGIVVVSSDGEYQNLVLAGYAGDLAWEPLNPLGE